MGEVSQPLLPFFFKNIEDTVNNLNENLDSFRIKSILERGAKCLYRKMVKALSSI